MASWAVSIILCFACAFLCNMGIGLGYEMRNVIPKLDRKMVMSMIVADISSCPLICDPIDNCSLSEDYVRAYCSKPYRRSINGINRHNYD
ncbi:unnamed protein product [Sphenostylis stenocarpa]|uniref:Uncharacterized protein n=1 Tax=Sphenostylis stenocarpa TaxID=92480 RepID=A0AA86SE16_9FABA|nr:unnamed protein product [Sphenostylis stenocarpa]